MTNAFAQDIEHSEVPNQPIDETSLGPNEHQSIFD
jgi:hypothetical protein